MKLRPQLPSGPNATAVPPEFIGDRLTRTVTAIHRLPPILPAVANADRVIIDAARARARPAISLLQ